MNRKISFCTWILNRLHQFREVWPVNAARTAGWDVEFVLLDVGSTDGLPDYVAAIGDPRLHYHQQLWQQTDLHFARLYNAVHRLATGDVLVTLDADNAIGTEFCEAAIESATETSFMWATTGDWSGGTIGRVAFDRRVFERLGGYDESLGPIGYQDVDIMNRAKALGLYRRCRIRREVVGYAVPNTRAETASQLGLTAAQYRTINSQNQACSQANITAGRLIANAKGTSK